MCRLNDDTRMTKSLKVYMSFFKKLLFLDANHLVVTARTRLVTESDMLALPEELNPRVDLFDEKKFNFDSPRKHLFSTIVAGKKEMLTNTR